MNLTNGEIFDAAKPLNVLLQKELPVKVSYELATIANKLNEQLQIIEDVRKGLVKKYGAKNKETGKLGVDKESKDFDKFTADFEELMNQEVELVINKVVLPKEIDGKPLTIEAGVLMNLGKFVDVE